MPRALMLHTENSAVGSYRIWKPAKYLERMGWEIVRMPDQPLALPVEDAQVDDNTPPYLRKNWEQYGSWDTFSDGADIIVVARADNPDMVALALAMGAHKGCPVVFEVDDNLYDVAETSPAYQSFYPGSPYLKVAETFMQNADALTVSTSNLRGVYHPLNQNIHVLENCQDIEDWQGVENQNSGDKIVIGWGGGFTHYDDIKLIAPAIKHVLRRNENVIFRMIGFRPDFFMDMDRVELLTTPVHTSQWPQKLASLGFDIGLSPVVKRPFNLGKSNIKWQEYSMLEIPTIASDVGPYRVIEDGVTGIKVRNKKSEWIDAMEKLINDEQLRRQLGKQAKQKVIADFNIEKNIGHWDAAYRRIITDYQS